MTLRPNIATAEGMMPAAISRDPMNPGSNGTGNGQPVPPQPPKPNPEAENLKKHLEKYFANKPKAQIAADLMKKVDSHATFLLGSGREYLLHRSYQYYYRGIEKKGQLEKGGEQGEFLIGHFNHYRNILQHLLNLTTANRPAMEPRAANTDAKSQGQTIIAAGALDYIQREAHLDRILKKATEQAIYLSEAYAVLEWDENAGPDYVVDGEETKKQGDIKFTNAGPLDVFYDFCRDSSAKHDWYIVRFWENRYDYAAKYPELADKIMLLASDAKNPRNRRPWYVDTNDSDLIPVFRFYHDKTPAVPGGRFVEFLSSEIVTLDGNLPYRKKPVYRLMPDEQDGTPFGYSIAFDLMPIQEAIDGLLNTILTNISTFGVQNIAVPNGANIDVVQIPGGLNILKFDEKAGKPEVLQMLQVPNEVFEFVAMLTNMLETLSGLNSVVRGNPEASLKSGAALALIASQAIQFNSGLQQSYSQFCEDIGTGIIDILKEYGSTPRIASIAGKSNRSYMRYFKGEEIKDINRVTVERVNPLSSTTAGKMQIADTLMDKGLIKTPEEYIQLVTTGRLEPLLQAQQNQLTLIQAENEDLSEGKPVIAILTDDHVLHIKEHQAVLASPEARQDPKIVQVTLAHLTEHMNILYGGDPILTLLGQPSFAAPPSTPGGDNPPPAGAGSPADSVDATNPVIKEAENVNLPSMPTNPQTGEEFNPNTGGLPQ